MKILRHEEMNSGCSAQCNGNFESPWSNTIASYGDEHSYFAFELNYNYDVQDIEKNEDPIKCLSLNVSNLNKSIDYYTRLLNMNIHEKQINKNHVKLSYNLIKNSKSKYNFRLDNQCQLELIEINNKIDRGTGYGRKTLSCPINDIDVIQKTIEKEGYQILIPKMKLGGLLNLNKNTIVILSDPDGHEMCFVGEDKSTKYKEKN